jgi:hypothetical protein
MTVGGSHPTVAAILRNLARSLANLGHPLMARDHLDRALAIDQATYGDTHPDVARDLEALADLTRALDEPALAAQYDARAAAVRDKVAQAGQESTPLVTVDH